jgi:DASS family divalent anion:Na+ symporter
MLAIFICTILALMLRPLPGGAAVLIGVLLTILGGIFTMSQALSAYGGSTVWLVLAAFFISRALINSGLARRIALLLVRRIGQTSLGLGYSMVAADFILGSIIPAITARMAGVILPITRTLALIYNSHPGQGSARLGNYLMLTLYQGGIVVCAMFYTGQASNPIAAQLAQDSAQVTITWASWFYTGMVPGLAALLVVPWLIYRMYPPEIKRTPQAAEMAQKELEKMGPLSRTERIVLFVFILVCGLWATSSFHSIGTTTAALSGVAILFVTQTLTWQQAMKEHVAWDVFVWYGGLIRMSEGLNEFGLTSYFAGMVSGFFAGWEWPTLMFVIVLIYFFCHYGFASVTTHIISMYVPFMAVLITAGAPAPLVAYSMAYYTNLSAALTHYGTTPAPIVFAAGYVSHGRWWKTGLILSLVNLAIWTSLGLVWWKFLGLW